MIVFTVASVTGATPKEVICAVAFVKFPLTSAPMILEALPAGVSLYGRVRPPSLLSLLLSLTLFLSLYTTH